MAKVKDIKGQKFNHLTAVEFLRTEPKIGAIWKFKCDCGNYIEKNASAVTSVSSKTKSCGCLLHQPKIDLTGMKFNRLEVISFSRMAGRRRTKWLCKCECGNIVEVDGTHLKDGHTKSCGCLNKEKIKMTNYKTGLSNSRLYLTYRNMLNRCYREKDDGYDYYGGRGIKVCDEWLGENGFENFMKWAFKNGYEEDAERGNCTIDRINPNKDYSPQNCRWVDKYVQANNKRNNRYVKINGEIGTVANMARKYNVDYWNLMHYAKGGRNMMYPDLKIEVV